MATPRKPYVRMLLGSAEEDLGRGISAGAVFMKMRVHGHRDKRSIPGLLRMGPAALAESLVGGSLNTVKRQLTELEQAGAMLVDYGERLIYVVGAIEADPPVTVNAVRGMARQLRELPRTSNVVAHIKSAIEAAIAGSEHQQAWFSELREVPAYPEPGPEPTPEMDPEPGPKSGPLRRSADPQPVDPLSGDPATAAAYLRAWGRLPHPFAAAAPEDIQAAVQAFDAASFDVLVRQLATSAWVIGRMHVPPTLRALLDRPHYARNVIAGKYAATELRWRCPECEGDHSALSACASPCRGCGRRHSPGEYCRKLREIELAERAAAVPGSSSTLVEQEQAAIA